MRDPHFKSLVLSGHVVCCIENEDKQHWLQLALLYLKPFRPTYHFMVAMENPEPMVHQMDGHWFLKALQDGCCPCKKAHLALSLGEIAWMVWFSEVICFDSEKGPRVLKQRQVLCSPYSCKPFLQSQSSHN